MSMLLRCFEWTGPTKLCGGRVAWTRSDDGHFAGLCSRCRHHRRAVSGEILELEQLERDGRIGLTPAAESGPLE